VAPLSCRVDRDGSLTYVAVDGDLNMASVPPLHATLLKTLAECPTAVIVDMSGVVVRDLLALSVFPAVRVHTAEWPSVPLLICCLDPDLVSPRGRRRWLSDLPVFDSVAAARAAATRPDLLDRRMRAGLPHTGQAPAQARELLAIACRDWGLEHLIPAGQVIVSELSANAVCHTDGAARLVIIRGDRYLHLVVRDGSRRLPVMADDDSWDTAGEHGRGLRLVGALATSWGAQAVGDGKAVWATLPLRTRA
jgi:anti-anti-sigma regulatory factor